MLNRERLTISMITDASRLVSGESKAFDLAISTVIKEMTDGTPFAPALRQHPKIFDEFLCQIIDAPTSRNGLRSTLARACGENVAEESPAFDYFGKRVGC
jgi:type II secretory pathway component PulF